MTLRSTGRDALARARSPEEKAQVREAFILAGRELLAELGSAALSLRRVAAQAGYSPGTIYQYFADQQDLLREIRAQDMRASTAALRGLIEGIADPTLRVKALFVGTADYWVARMDEFLVTFPTPSLRLPPPSPSGASPFGQSQVVREAMGLYYDTVETFFATLAKPPMPAQLATDTLVAAVHGMIVFPFMTRTMHWPETRIMIETLVDTVVGEWSRGG